MSASITRLDVSKAEEPYAYLVIATPRDALLAKDVSHVKSDELYRGNLVAVAEPISMTAILMYFVGLILKAIVGEIINKIFGKGKELEGALREMIQKIGQIMQEALAQDRLNKTIDRLRSLQRQMEAYAADPVTMKGTLDHMAQTAHDLYADAEGLGLVGTHARAMAATLMTAVYCEIALTQKSEGIWKYAQRNTDLLNDALPELTQALIERVASRFGSVEYHPKTGNMEVDGNPAYWSYKIDGRPAYGLETFEDPKGDVTRAHRAAAISQSTNQALTEIIVPADAVAKKLLELKKRNPPWLALPQS